MLSLKSAYTILNRYIILLCNFALVLYTTHLWGSEGRGIITLMITNISIINILSNVTSGSTISFYASKMNKASLMLFNFLGALLLSFTGSILICLFFGWADFGRYLLVSLLTTLTNSIALYYLGKADIKKYNLFSLINVASILIILSCFISSVGIALPVDYYFYSLYIGLSLSLLLGVYFILGEKVGICGNIKIKDLKDLVSYGLKNELSYLLQFLCYRLSYFIIAKDLGISALGIFSVAVSLIESVWVVSKSMSALHYSSVVNNSRSDQNISATKKTAINSLLISILLSVIMIIIPNEIYAFVFGRDFSGIKLILIYLIPGCIAISFSNIHGHYFSAIGNQSVLIKKSIIGLFTLMITLVILVPWYGIAGVCIAMNFAYIFQSVYLLFCFNKLISERAV